MYIDVIWTNFTTFTWENNVVCIRCCVYNRFNSITIHHLTVVGYTESVVTWSPSLNATCIIWNLSEIRTSNKDSVFITNKSVIVIKLRVQTSICDVSNLCWVRNILASKSIIYCNYTVFTCVYIVHKISCTRINIFIVSVRTVVVNSWSCFLYVIALAIWHNPRIIFYPTRCNFTIRTCNHQNCISVYSNKVSIIDYIHNMWNSCTILALSISVIPIPNVICEIISCTVSAITHYIKLFEVRTFFKINHLTNSICRINIRCQLIQLDFHVQLWADCTPSFLVKVISTNVTRCSSEQNVILTERNSCNIFSIYKRTVIRESVLIIIIAPSLCGKLISRNTSFVTGKYYVTADNYRTVYIFSTHCTSIITNSNHIRIVIIVWNPLFFSSCWVRTFVYTINSVDKCFIYFINIFLNVIHFFFRNIYYWRLFMNSNYF